MATIARGTVRSIEGARYVNFAEGAASSLKYMIHAVIK
jgi:hypothetical protein